MNTIFLSFSELFIWVVTTSIMASVIVPFILLITLICKHRLHAQWMYALWFVLILRLILPWTPESSVSIYNVFSAEKGENSQLHTLQSVPFSTTNESLPIHKVTDVKKMMDGFNKQDGIEAASHEQRKKSFVFTGLFLIWITGVALTARSALLRSIRFLKKVNKEPAISDARIIRIFEECKKKTNSKANIPLIKTCQVASPALYGFVNSKLLLPEKWIETLSENELRYVFLHELVHFKRKDIGINWLMNCLLMIHWFNPILWYAYYRMREDQEIACDALALSYINPHETKEYGYTIIKLLENASDSLYSSSTTSFSRSTSYVKRRITTIAMCKRNTSVWSIVGVMIFLLVGCTTLTNATTKEDVHAAMKEDVVAAFKDGSAQLLKSDPIVLEHDLSDEQDRNIMLSWWLMYVEAKKAGIEASPEDIKQANQFVEQEREKFKNDKETRNNHKIWMEKYRLPEKEYWEHVRKVNHFNLVVNEYVNQKIGTPEQMDGSEYKKAFNQFMDQIYMKYKEQVIINEAIIHGE
ncbi:M56 family metallopeptidase [Aneurinibacillus sp. REN35]|uniref:M56 family metallopeptidase n=2 Tax=Paenibacillaceae TaxID=186822 RepID=UPI0035275FA9